MKKIKNTESAQLCCVSTHLDVLPGVHDLVGRIPEEPDVPPPRVEVGGVGLDVLGALGEPVRVKHKLVGGEEHGAKVALDALGPGRVVPGREELAAAAPGALVKHLEGKVVRELGGRVVAEEALAEPLRLPPGDHAAAAGRDGHGAGPAEDLQLRKFPKLSKLFQHCFLRFVMQPSRDFESISELGIIWGLRFCSAVPKKMLQCQNENGKRLFLGQT